ncbi:glycosyl hydrolases family 31-domain-containing protein [Scenedesmus sp. NREL 46B-D3]|nr:glycosyl hydrolases family 31-domain-containing protein [Scenedesmus sp. NREL 46B-D3]
MERLSVLVLMVILAVHRSVGASDVQQPRLNPTPGNHANAGGRVATAAASGPKAEQQWRTYLHTKEGLTKEGLIDSASSMSGATVSRLRLSKDLLPEYGASFDRLAVEATPETPTRLHIKVYPTEGKRWEVPESIVPRPRPNPNLSRNKLTYDFTTEHKQHDGLGAGAFAIKVNRKSNGAPLFDTTGSRFVFKDQYIELTTKLPKSADVMGLGQMIMPGSSVILRRDGSPITLWNRDLPGALAEPYTNLHSSHPFYLQANRDGFSHGVLFLNSNGMDVILGEESLTYKVIGGLVDLYIFAGPSPEDVMQQYQQVIGTPAMPPFWALGNHQARWGYSNYSVVEQVVRNFSRAGVPLEAVWSDIDYMNNRFQTLTLDTKRFPVPKMRALVDKMNAAGQQWVPVHDAGISKMRGYKAYDDGSAANIWMNDYKGQPYVGQVWPGEAVWPDYVSNANTSAWLTEQVASLYKQVPFGGLWMDMSEPANFCTGVSCQADPANKQAVATLTAATPKDFNIAALIRKRTTCQLKCERASPTDKLASPPYAIHNFDITTKTRRHDIEKNIVSVTAKHADGTVRYNTHNLHGTAMAQQHYNAYVAATNKRPFNIIRSTFPGSGRYAGHWTGDNRASWKSLAESVAQTLTPSMWGISMVGPNICGYSDTALASAEQQGFQGSFSTKSKGDAVLDDKGYEQLCNRWTSAGAFYPFSRNHVTLLARPHEPYRWPAVAAAARKAYGLRYQLLSYLYSSLFLAHSQGGTLARPLLFVDPSDAAARSADGQWMMGEALMVSPVLRPDTTTVKKHFPKGNWYSAWDYTKTEVTKPKAHQLDIPLGDVAVHYRGGAIIPTQRYANVTRRVRFSPVTLLVALPLEVSGSQKPEAKTLQGAAPYAGQEACAAVHSANAGRLVSCGLLYSDRDAVEVGSNNTVQVWYAAITSADGKQGGVSSSIKANAGDAAGKLRIEAIHILGLPTTAPAAAVKAPAANAKAPAAQKKAPAAAAKGAAANATAPAPGAKPAPAAAGQEAAAAPALVAATATVNGQAVKAAYDGKVGVLKITGLKKVVVGGPFTVRWKI